MTVFSVFKIFLFFSIFFKLLICQAHGLRQSSYISLQKFLESNHMNSVWNKKTNLIVLKFPENNTKITFMPNNNFFWINSTIHFIKKPLYYKGGHFMIPKSISSQIKSFFKKTERKENAHNQNIQRILPVQKIQNLSQNKPIILIDAGHGGKDNGAIGYRNFKEKDINLETSLMLRNFLIQEGFDVIMTRTTDSFLTLGKRTRIANRSKADLFISIHSNSSHDKTAHGLEIYYLSNHYKTHNRAKTLNPFIMKNHFLLRPTQTNAPYTFQILSELVLNHNRRLSQSLGKIILKEMQYHTHQVNRGLKPSRFYVLKNTNIPSILIELGFISNPSECLFLKRKIKTIAQSILSGIKIYTKECYK